jgi:hypothetical protein
MTHEERFRTLLIDEMKVSPEGVALDDAEEDLLDSLVASRGSPCWYLEKLWSELAESIDSPS